MTETNNSNPSICNSNIDTDGLETEWTNATLIQAVDINNICDINKYYKTSKASYNKTIAEKNLYLCDTQSKLELVNPIEHFSHKTEYNTLQNNRIEEQQKYLDNIQTEIASKNAVLDIYNTSVKKKRDNLKVLKVFFIFIIFFFAVLWAKASGHICKTSFILSIATLIISYVYYVVWTLNKDNIANMSKKDIKIIGEVLGLDNNEKGVFNSKSDDDSYLNNYKYKQRNEFIGEDCDCPSGGKPKPSGGGGHDKSCKIIKTNKANVYYDKSSPKERLFPVVTEEDAKPFKESIQTTDDNTTEALIYADPNVECEGKRCETDNDINTNEYKSLQKWTLDI